MQILTLFYLNHKAQLKGRDFYDFKTLFMTFL